MKALVYSRKERAAQLRKGSRPKKQKLKWQETWETGPLLGDRWNELTGRALQDIMSREGKAWCRTMPVPRTFGSRTLTFRPAGNGLTSARRRAGAEPVGSGRRQAFPLDTSYLFTKWINLFPHQKENPIKHSNLIFLNLFSSSVFYNMYSLRAHLIFVLHAGRPHLPVCTLPGTMPRWLTTASLRVPCMRPHELAKVERLPLAWAAGQEEGVDFRSET